MAVPGAGRWGGDSVGRGTVSDLQDEKALGTEGCWLHHVNALGTAEPYT